MLFFFPTCPLGYQLNQNELAAKLDAGGVGGCVWSGGYKTFSSVANVLITK